MNLQGSSWNRGDAGRFTLNLGVYFPAEAALGESTTAGREKPAQVDCIVSERIGCLLPGARDYWWQIEREGDEERVGTEAAEALAEYGIPWLEAHSGSTAAQAWAERKGLYYWAAVFALQRGEVDGARKLVRRAANEAQGRPELVTRLRSWAAKHGLE